MHLHHTSRPSVLALVTIIAGAALSLGGTTLPATADAVPVSPVLPAPVSIPSTVIPGPTGVNDGVDDTADLQAAINAAAAGGGGTVLLSAGQYDLSIPAGTTGTDRVALTLPSKVRLLGSADAGTTFRLAAGQGNYYAVMRTPAGSSDVAIENFVVDANSAGNPVTTEADLTGQPRLVWITSGQRVEARGMRFANTLGTQVLSLYSTDTTIVDNDFVNVGGGSVNFDHSSIYTRGDRTLVSGNVLESLHGPGTFGVRTAIEIHNSDQTVINNTVSGFLKGINATGAGLGSVSYRQLYADNHLIDVGLGMYLWSTSSAGTASLHEVEVRDNTITINADGWRSSGMGSYTVLLGIGTHPANDSPISELLIQQNTITFTNDTITRDDVSYLYDSMAAGISLWRNETAATAPAPALSNVTIRDNEIVNPLSAGIWSNTPLLGESQLSGNIITNPGRNNRLDKPWTSGVIIYQPDFRSGVYLKTGNQTLAVSGTQVIIDDPTIALHAGVTAPAACNGTNSASTTTIVGSSAPLHDLNPCWSVL
ncbi:hypothetical protein [Microlunatus sp. Y2014]|uniref:hypothetical protein n=1 Tax=Microlunatus sp. Y2014 TaxID=3418488 RepID=UPI003DA70DEE